MIMIRSAQVEALEAGAMAAFEDRTYEHLQGYFPRHCLLLGEEQMRIVIRLGWQKAESYDLAAECCVRSYIEFMCLLGSGFDKDPLMPWAARILNDKVTFGEVERCDRLYDQVWDYINYISQDYRDATGKPTTARFVSEISDLRRRRNDIVTENNYVNFAGDLTLHIQNVFPAKCRYVGEKRIQDLISQGTKAAAAYGITTERGVTLFTVYMFLLGSGFAEDPLFPWAKAILNDKGDNNQIDVVERLCAEGAEFLKPWWNFAPEQEVNLAVKV